MSLTRRHFIQMTALVSAGVGASCRAALARDALASYAPSVDKKIMLPLVKEQAAISSPTPTSDDALIRLLNRAGYGAPQAERERAAELGFAGWLAEQLDPDSIDDGDIDVWMAAQPWHAQSASDLFNAEQIDRAAIAAELIGATLMRAAHSKKQLYEAMVEFWSDHFNVYLRKNGLMPPLKLAEDRDVIRPNALGNFRDLLYASATSPAMLVYLDNAQNLKSAPNENYARELMELHTLGVDGGYTEGDVKEVARALTGWTVERRGATAGTIKFVPQLHDDAEKVILGQTFPAGQGQGDLDQLVDLLATHPTTANFIASKLVRRFVSDTPLPELTAELAGVFLSSSGDIKSLLAVLFSSAAFADAPPKLRRPYSVFVASLRTLGIVPNVSRLRTRQRRRRRSAEAIGQWLALMGQIPFSWPAPNGYPDVSAAWQDNLLPRWNFAIALASNSIDGVQIDLNALIAHLEASHEEPIDALAIALTGMPFDPTSTQYFETLLTTIPNDETALQAMLAGVLASPAFQII